MFSKNFPLAFAHDVPWGACKSKIKGAIPLSRHAFLGSCSGFCFLNAHFFLEKLENLATLISRVTTVSGSWAVGHLSMGHVFATVVSTSIFLYQSPLFIYIICLSPLGIGVCTPYSEETVLFTHLYLSKSYSSLMVHLKCQPLFSPSIRCMFSFFWIFTAFLTPLL